MKRALLLLVLVCLLIATPMLAAAYEPTNVIALDDNYYAIKTIEKEEVATLMASEKVTTLVSVKNPWTRQYLLVVLAVSYAVAVAYIFSPTTEAGNRYEWRCDRVSSRFT